MDGNTRTITIENHDQHTLYLALNIEKLLHPGLPNETYVGQLKTNPKQFGLLVNTQKIIIPAKQRRSFTINSINDRAQLKHDVVYRIRTVPMENATFIVAKKSDKKVSGGVNFIPEYDIMCFVIPEKHNNTVTVIQSKNNVVLKNTHNSVNAVANLYNCPKKVTAQKVEQYYKNERYRRIIKQLGCKRQGGANYLFSGGGVLRYSIPTGRRLVIILYNGGDHKAIGFTG